MITIATCLFDLGRRENNPHRKSAAHYLERARVLLAALAPLSVEVRVYADPELKGAIPLPSNDENIAIVPIALEDLRAYSDLERIRDARKRLPLDNPNPPKDTPLYAVFQRAKIEIFRATSFETEFTAWIDLGIVDACPVDRIDRAIGEALKLDRVQLSAFRSLETIRDFTRTHNAVAGGFLAGPSSAVVKFADTYAGRAEHLLHAGIVPHDETLLEDLAVRHPELFTIRPIVSYAELLA